MAADAVGIVQQWLQTRFPTHRAVTELPGDLVAASPCHRVARPGGSRHLTLDVARMSIQTFVAGPQHDARAIAESVADAMQYELPGTALGGGMVTKVEIGTPPVVITYDNPNVRMATHSYTVHVLTV